MLEEYRMYILKEKHLFQNMNFLREKNHIYHVYCWVPLIYEEQVMTILRDVSKNDKNIVTGQLQESNLGSLMKPPTFFRTNEFTAIFQVLIFFKFLLILERKSLTLMVFRDIEKSIQVFSRSYYSHFCME